MNTPSTSNPRVAVEEALDQVCASLERRLFEPPWWERVRAVAESLRLEQIDPDDLPPDVFTSGWRRLRTALAKHGGGLSLPDGVTRAWEVVPRETRNWLDVQWALSISFEGGNRSSLSLLQALGRVPDALEGLTIGGLLARLRLSQDDAKVLESHVLYSLGRKSPDASLLLALEACSRASFAVARAFARGFGLSVEEAREIVAEDASRAFLLAHALHPTPSPEQAAVVCCLLGAMGGKEVLHFLVRRLRDERQCGDETVGDIVGRVFASQGKDAGEILLGMMTLPRVGHADVHLMRPLALAAGLHDGLRPRAAAAFLRVLGDRGRSAGARGLAALCLYQIDWRDALPTVEQAFQAGELDHIEASHIEAWRARGPWQPPEPWDCLSLFGRVEQPQGDAQRALSLRQRQEVKAVSSAGCHGRAGDVDG